MAATLDVSCPSCGKALRVPAELEGRRVKCKGCAEVFPVRAGKAKAPPAAAAKPKPKPKPAPAAETGAKPAAPTAAPPKGKVTWDDHDDDSTAVGVIKEADIPRCPHCAQELDPPDAIVCIHCGFNSRTREKAATRKVYASSGADKANHLLPGILAAVGIVAVLTLDVVAAFNMRSWMEGGIMESETELMPDGVTKKMHVSPGAFVMGLWFVSLGILGALGKIAWARLVKESKPQEAEMK